MSEELKKERLYIIILAAIQVAHILDFVIMMPLGPMFMRTFHITPVAFSTLVSAYTFSAGIVGFLGALYADHFDRKKFLLFNFTGFIIGTFLCARAWDFSSLLSGRIIAGAFGGILNASVLSLVADLIPFERRGRAMGVVMSAFSISSILGVPTGLYIANQLNWHWSFYFICLVSLVFWLMSLLILPSVKQANKPRGFVDNLQNFKKIILQKDYWHGFFLTSMLGFSIFMIIPFISPYMVRNVGVAEKDLPLIYLIGGLCTIVSARVIGQLCDKLGSFTMFKRVAIISLFPVLMLTNLPPVPLWCALACTTVFTMFGSGRFIPAMTMVSAVVKPEDRGTFMSLENSLRQLSSGLSSQLAGLIIGMSVSGRLTHYSWLGFLSVFCTLTAILIAYHLKNKFQFR